jgi:uncharacterized protein (DUF1697 family)
MASTGVHVALLRGINVGGKNSLPMKDLAAMFNDAGCRDIRTYIQSGNVLFGANAKLAARIPELIAKAIADTVKLQVPVLVRSAEELGVVPKKNPFLKEGADIEALHVAFLADPPDGVRISELDAKRSPGDRFRVQGREIYLHLPNGVARTKLTNQYFDSKLATTSTMRNWKTVLKLIELATAV